MGCWYCGGRGEYVSCIDDLCHGQEECMHGDGMSICPECKGQCDDFDDDFDPEDYDPEEEHVPPSVEAPGEEGRG